jgi:hypothetical protein
MRKFDKEGMTSIVPEGQECEKGLKIKKQVTSNNI